MEIISDVSRFVHVLFGAVGLAAFWVPVVAKKGAVNHVRFGKIFANCAYIVLGAAALALVARVATMVSQHIGLDDKPATWAFVVFSAI